MDYFLDTNVEIGYVFYTDPWNAGSVNLLEKDDILHYSSCVDKEFNIKYQIILKQQKNFFRSLKKELIESSKDKLSLKDLKIKSKIILLRRDFEENKKDKIAEVIWKFSKSKHEHVDELNDDVCNVEDLLKCIDKIIRGFDRKLIERRNDFERKVIYHSKRDEEYMDLNEKLLFEVGVHYPDNCIILDAHDLSLKECITLQFITADEDMINKVNNMLDLFFIDKFIYLKDFC